jgi:hypothetical protein
MGSSQGLDLVLRQVVHVLAQVAQGARGRRGRNAEKMGGAGDVLSQLDVGVEGDVRTGRRRGVGA